MNFSILSNWANRTDVAAKHPKKVERLDCAGTGLQERLRGLNTSFLDSARDMRIPIASKSPTNQDSPTSRSETIMQAITHMPIFFAAAQYSLAYLLCGGGIVGAAGIYVVAKMMGK